MRTQFVAGLQPSHAARVAGALYLLIIAGGLFAEAYVRGQLIVFGDPAATAHNILEHELLYRLGFAANLTYLACALPLALIFYGFFERVNRPVAMLALAFNLVAIGVEAVNLLNHLAPLRILGARGLEEFAAAEQLAYLHLRLFGSGFGISLAFFGFVCLLNGFLIFRSGFLPRFLGVLLAIAGACYLLNSYALFIAPPLASLLFPYILVPCLLAELSLALWLVSKGVDIRIWDDEATLREAPR